MSINKLREEIVNIFEDITLKISNDNRILISVEKKQILNILSFLKNKGFDHLALISCVDWIKENEFEIVYILTSYLLNDDKNKTHIILKTKISRKKPEIMSTLPIFINAEPYEREIHELFGVNFNGNNRLMPLLLEREYKIPPFRKDFDTREYVKNFYGEIPEIIFSHKKRKNKKIK